jgi:NTP pyrophosphatase (non-canonical NTP hydrolase)
LHGERRSSPAITFPAVRNAGDSAMSELDGLRDALRVFAEQRDWDQFHSPKNLATALSVEASELLEHFQWLTEEQSRTLSSKKAKEVALEMADILLYLVRLADKMNVDLIREANAKIEINASKYPAEKVRGSSRKYTEWSTK